MINNFRKIDLLIPILDDLDLIYGTFFVPLSMIDEPYRSEIEKNCFSTDLDEVICDER